MTTTMIKISKENRQKLNEMKARFNFKSANSTITYLIYIADKCLGKKEYTNIANLDLPSSSGNKSEVKAKASSELLPSKTGFSKKTGRKSSSNTPNNFKEVNDRD